MIFVRDRKKTAEKVWKEWGVTTHARKVVEVSTILLGNDKNNVIANKVFNYF